LLQEEEAEVSGLVSRGGQREDTNAANDPSDASWIAHFFTSGMNDAEDSNREVTGMV